MLEYKALLPRSSPRPAAARTAGSGALRDEQTVAPGLSLWPDWTRYGDREMYNL